MMNNTLEAILVTILVLSVVGELALIVLVFVWRWFESTRLGNVFMDWLESRKEE